MEEIWKDIEGYEGLYQVSNLGRVKSLERKVKTINNGTECLKFICERILKPKTNRGGYKVVLLYNQSKRKHITVHRLVAKAFIPNPSNYPVINHKDECKTNNTVWINEDGSIDQEKSNLEWCTVLYNNNYGTAIKRGSEKRKGVKQPAEAVKLRCKKIYQYAIDGTLIKIWDSVKEAQKEYNNTHIADCARGERKTSSGFIWKYGN